MTTTEKFEAWAIVELFGHQKLAGRVSEQTIGSATFIRVDVPELPARPSPYYPEKIEPAIPAYTRYFGPGAIYGITPMPEASAHAAASAMRARPAFHYEIESSRPTLLTCDDEAD